MSARAETHFMLTEHCDACNREPEMEACPMCSLIEDAERKAGGEQSPQLVAVEHDG